MIMKYLLFLTLILAGLTQELSYDQFINSTPNTYGLITVTHARNGVYSYFKKHLDMYASMECPEITEISVVWNNDVTPESVGFVQDPKWKIPVYFVKTPYNSMDFRYTLPAQSKAKVFFSIDDDVIVSCAQLRKSFSFWREKAIGDVAPLISYGPRGYSFDLKRQQFTYGDPLKARLFSIALIGICWVPRFYLELYNSQKSWQINSMREYVKQKNNCDDIALNFIVSYFFPELVPIALDGAGKISMQIHPASQATSKTHYPFRNQCLKKFTEIFGYNPLRIVSKQINKTIDRYESVVNKYVIYLKRKQIEDRLLSQSRGDKETSVEEIMKLQERIRQDIAQKSQKIKGQVIPENVVSSNENIETLKKQLDKMKQEYLELQKKIASKKPETDNPLENKESLQNQPEIKIQKLDQLDFILYGVVGVTIFVTLMCICFFKDCCQQNPEKQPKMKKPKKSKTKKTKNKIPVPQSIQIQQNESQDEQQ